MYLTASSNIPSRSNRPGLEHIENPPTTDTPGIKKSTLKSDENQKLKQAKKQNQTWKTVGKTELLALFLLPNLYKDIFTSTT